MTSSLSCFNIEFVVASIALDVNYLVSLYFAKRFGKIELISSTDD